MFKRYFFFSSNGKDTIYKKSFLCLFLYSSKLQIILHGFPAATVLDGISLFTILPAPMITLSPIVTFGRITDLQPIKQFLPILILPYITVSGFSPGRFLITLVSASCVTKAQSNEIVVLSPIVIR